MLTIEEIRAKIERTLIDTDGNPEPQDMALIVREAREAGIDDRQIARLVPETDRAINWEKVRAERDEKAAKAAQEAAFAKDLEEELAAAAGHLDALITFCMADGSATTAELQTIFAKSTQLQQSDIKTAGRVKAAFDAAGFRPFPNANLNAASLKEVLLSTNWHNAERYAKLTTAPLQQPIQQNPPQPAAGTSSAAATPAAESTASRLQPLPAPRISPVPQPLPKPFNPPKKKSSGVWWILLVLIIPLYFVLKHEGVLTLSMLDGDDADAVKARTVASSAALRSAMNTSTQSNIIGDLQYGTEFTVLDTIGSWLRIKTTGEEGYVASSLTVGESDFQRLNSIFADEESREAIPATRYRLALLDYFRQHNYSGAMITAEGDAAPKSSEIGEQWEVKADDGKPGTIYFGKVINANSRYSDFGVLITQKASGKRRFLLFSFDEAGNSSLAVEQEAPDRGNILSVMKKTTGSGVTYVVKYG